MLLSVFLVAFLLWIGTYAPAPARMEYAHLEVEISKIYGLSAKVPPASYVLVTDTVTITRAESLSQGELIIYGDIQLVSCSSLGYEYRCVV
uniref:Peptidase S1 domain-containing protein n=1 Tax=Ascaris lumbricoides TaxID=6252 RepID=A0A0M3HU72_ASCLU